MHDKTTAYRAERSSPLLSRVGPASGCAGNAVATDAGKTRVPAERYQSDPPPGTAPVTAVEDAATGRERLGWQIRATRVLADLLALALRDGLPRIAWTVGDAGANLAGRCYGRTGGDRRRQFEAWSAVVGAVPRPERTDFSGITHLSAVVKQYDGLVDIVLLADLFPEEEDQ